ncbi:hypothetical protein ACSYAD_31655 [Acaryochloris marina NIES-2412]|uniref:hypothetical protein n=1 Tax=Acaryochloris marina TaxID=155978 RepID=UPI00405910FF
MQRNFILLCILGPVFVFVSACSNPVNELYKKPVDQGQKAIDKAGNVQQKIDKTQSNLDQQEKSLVGEQDNR